MKKKYIAPEITTVKVNNVILAGSEKIGVNGDATEGTNGWGSPQSRYNVIDFTDDDDDYAGNW